MALPELHVIDSLCVNQSETSTSSLPPPYDNWVVQIPTRQDQKAVQMPTPAPKFGYHMPSPKTNCSNIGNWFNHHIQSTFL